MTPIFAPQSAASDLMADLALAAMPQESTDLLARRLHDEVMVASDRASSRDEETRSKAYRALIRSAAIALALADRIRPAERPPYAPTSPDMADIWRASNDRVGSGLDTDFPDERHLAESRHRPTSQETFADLERKGLA